MIIICCRRCSQNSKVYEELCAYRGQKTVNKFTHLSDDKVIMIKMINEESIHLHNAFGGMVSLI